MVVRAFTENNPSCWEVMQVTLCIAMEEKKECSQSQQIHSQLRHEGILQAKGPCSHPFAALLEIVSQNNL